MRSLLPPVVLQSWTTWAPRGAALATLALCAGAFTGCGGGGGGGGAGGGGGGGGGSAFQLSFQPGTLTARYYQGEASTVAVEVRANQAHTAPVQVAVIDAAGVTGAAVEVTAVSNLVYRASLPLSRTLAAGTYTGTIEVRVCEDAPLTCARPVAGSPWRLPYEITVAPQSDLRPLSLVPGVSGWAGYRGDAARSATKVVPVSPPAIARRWAAPEQFPGARESPAVADGGLVVTLVQNVAGGAPTLLARREHDGSLAWSRTLGTQNDEPDRGPTLAEGRIYVFTSSGLEGTTLWSVDLATGAVVGQRRVAGYTAQQHGPLFLAGKLYSCRSAGTGAGLTRYDAGTLEPEATLPLSASTQTCVPATDGRRIYVFANKSLTAWEPGSSEAAYVVPFDTAVDARDLVPVLLGDGRLVVSAYSPDSSLADTGRLYAFDTETRQLLWQVQGAFNSPAVVAGNTVFVLNTYALEARSLADGALLWSVTGTSASGLGGADSTLIATGTHVFAGSNWTTEAIDVQSRSRVWSEVVGGPLALSPQGVLYISPSFGGGVRAVNLR